MKKRILFLLSLVPGALPESVLKIEFRMRFKIELGETEMADALRELERAALVASATDDLTGDREWKITKLGEEKL